MRFILHTTALNGNDEVHDLIDRLVDRVADEVHRVEVPEADLLQESIWYQSARQTRRRILIAAVAIPPRKHTGPYEPHAKQVDIRNVAEALVADKLAHTPLTILVEDRESDGTLLEIMVEELGTERMRNLWMRGFTTTPRAIDIDTAGGIGSMPQRIRRAVGDAEAESRPVRLLVLCDSDARWPGDTTQTSHTDVSNLRQECTNLSIPLHILNKRTAENYIPDAVIEAVRDDDRNTAKIDNFNALLRRSKVQRDHFPLKDGLSGDERTKAIEAGLYQLAEGRDLDLLETRLFPKRPRPLLLLRDEHRSEFTGQGLQSRDGNNEIDTLLKIIAEEL